MDPERVPEVTPVAHGGTGNPDLLDFSTNVNPTVPEGVDAVYRDALSHARSYPSGGYPRFCAAAADHVSCDRSLIVPTAGGMAAIRLAVGLSVAPGDSVLVPTPSFGEYAREVRLQGGNPAFVAHDRLPEAAVGDHALVICCTPNNPTGESYDPGTLEALADRCRDADTVLLVDEAFLGFTPLPSMAGRDGVVVARSLTKLFGLPGLRAGFAVSTGEQHTRLRNASPPWPLGIPAARVGAHCLRDRVFVRRTRERVAAERDRLRDRLEARFEVHSSDAPFLLLDVGGNPAPVIDRARERGVAVRDATTFRGLDAHIRVAIRTPDDNDRLLRALDV